MIIKEMVTITPLKSDRMLHIYMPDDVNEGERFPVLYMFDGHNLFYDEDATYGKSWGIKDYLDKYKGRLIVVGIECNHEGVERLREFSPYPFEDEGIRIQAKGKTFAKWMVDELKPYIDDKYPTLPDREYTSVGGSSMGGLMALYMVCMYSEVYAKGVSVSPHLYPMYRLLKRDLQNVQMCQGTQVFISWGGYEYPTHKLFATVTDQNLQLIRILMQKPGVDVLPHVFKNDNHTEKAWEKELHVWMEELGFVSR